MKELINEIFSNICNGKFLRNDDEVIIGKVKDVIDNLKQQTEFVNNSDNKLDEDEIKSITAQVNELIEQINNMYPNIEDVIKIEIHPMTGFYILADKKSLLEDLKEYYGEMEEN